MLPLGETLLVELDGAQRAGRIRVEDSVQGGRPLNLELLGGRGGVPHDGREEHRCIALEHLARHRVGYLHHGRCRRREDVHDDLGGVGSPRGVLGPQPEHMGASTQAVVVARDRTVIIERQIEVQLIVQVGPPPDPECRGGVLSVRDCALECELLAQLILGQGGLGDGDDRPACGNGDHLDRCLVARLVGVYDHERDLGVILAQGHAALGSSIRHGRGLRTADLSVQDPGDQELLDGIVIVEDLPGRKKEGSLFELCTIEWRVDLGGRVLVEFLQCLVLAPRAPQRHEDSHQCCECSHDPSLPLGTRL